ncbi:multicopper oxidase family protein [Natrinema marinum]|uniref:multicopper oxidase family protein n=1 Tax=Natrinema marinum TaxID=2961598 RepID=UPI0020C92776|nr:multicopper oxidase domain-containing protein [Natrinema marinum]
MTEYGLDRRRFMKAGTALGMAGVLPWNTVAASESTPELEKFVQPMPIPDVLEPDGWWRGGDYYEIPMEEVEKKVHPDLPPTTMWGFDGQVPGPVIKSHRYERINVRYDNSALPEEHIFEVDDMIHGTSPEDYEGYDGAVPEVRTSIHQHGLNVERSSDGQARAWDAPDGTKGPQFVKHVHELPNRQERMIGTYHDHALGVSRLNNYAGLHGFYFIEGWEEKRLNLPRGEYDVPIMLEDRAFEEDGSLHYPDSFVPNFAGDTAFINGAVWPYMEVEPRRYRFRLVNQSNGRTFAIALENEDGHDAPAMHQIAPGHGFLEDVVSIGHEGDLEELIISPYERAEVVVDFSEYAGETLTMTNDAAFPYAGPHGGHDGGHGDGDMDMGGDGGMDMGGDGGMDMGGDKHFPDIPELMQFRVADSVSEPDRSAEPAELDLPSWHGPNENAVKETRQMTLGMRMKMNEPDLHVLNGKASFEGGEHAKPQLGSTEIWELENTGHHSHPIHLHLVNFEIIGRGPDGTHEPAPNERGPKDIVRVDPGETARILVKFENYTGKYPWHCHVLEHEEHAMMRQFEVVGGKGRGRNRGRRDRDRGRRDRDRGRRDRDRDRGDRDRDRDRDRGWRDRWEDQDWNHGNGWGRDDEDDDDDWGW